MTYLLDVSALVALGNFEHEFHPRVAAWVQTEDSPVFTCSITELGFIRVLSHRRYGFSIAEAQALLLGLKTSSRQSFSFLADTHDASRLPRWVKTPKQTTDGHLLELAKASGALFATLDERIPGAYLIPRTSR